MRINIPMTAGLESYVDAVGYREHAVLARCRAEAAGRGALAVMQVAPEQGAFLQWLVRLTGARRVLEIGTFTGYSSLAMALALPPGGRLVTCDVSADYVAVARAFWAEAGVADRIEAHLGDAREVLPGLDPEPFDLVLIDADKPGYPEYVARALERLRVGGVMVVDDTLLHGRVVSGPQPGDPPYVGPAVDAVRSVNEALFADASLDVVLLPWRDGVTLVRKAA